MTDNSTLHRSGPSRAASRLLAHKEKAQAKAGKVRHAYRLAPHFSALVRSTQLRLNLAMDRHGGMVAPGSVPLGLRLKVVKERATGWQA